MKLTCLTVAIVSLLCMGSAYAAGENKFTSAMKDRGLTGETLGSITSPTKPKDDLGLSSVSRGVLTTALPAKSGMTLINAESGLIAGEAINVDRRWPASFAPDGRKSGAAATKDKSDGYALLLACLGGVLFLAGRRIDRSGR